MASDRPNLRGEGFAWRMAVLYGAMFALAGTQLPYFPVWLGAKGLDSNEIGLVLAAAMVVRPVIVPVATRMADRFGWSKGPLVAAAWVACATFVFVAFGDGFAAILVAYAISALPQALMLPLADAYALRGLAARAGGYGRVRLWGSVTFIAANLGGGFLLERLGAGQMIWPMVALFAATALSASLLLPLPARRPETSEPQGAATSLWRSRSFIAVVVAASLIQASHAVYYGFSSLQWAAKGLQGPTIGALWAIGVAAEIALFAVSGRVMAWLRPLDLIGLGALGAIVRWAAMAFDPPALMLPLLQCLHALSFGATHLGAMHALASLGADRQGATAQGDYSVVVAIVLAVEMSLAGVLVEAVGTYAYLAMAVSAAIAGAIVLGARRWGAG